MINQNTLLLFIAKIVDIYYVLKNQNWKIRMAFRKLRKNNC